MKIYRNIDEIKGPLLKPYVTIGNFDGVHCGHQQLFARVVKNARERKGTSVAITFDPHPLQVLLPGGIKLISTCDQKVELIEMSGIDVLLIIPFTREFAKTTAESFVADLLVKRIGLQELIVGYDYAFGKGRSGNIDFLKKKGDFFGFPVTVIEPYYEEDHLVSSSKIRQLVVEGKMVDARALLGRHYQIRGTVQVGKQRGGPEIGFPTANLKLDEEDLIPRLGVYVTQVICDGICYGGVLNIGYNPTFGEEQLVAETHIFDFNKDIYGRPININLLKFLRSEQKFSGVDELAAQISRDVLRAKQVLAGFKNELIASCSEWFNQ